MMQQEGPIVKDRKDFSKRKGCLWVIVVFTLLSLIFCGAISYAIYGRYQEWEKDFVENLGCDARLSAMRNEDEVETFRENYKSDLEGFGVDDNFIELDEKETLVFILDNLNEQSPEDLSFQDFCVNSEEDEWEFAIKPRWRDYDLPWTTIFITNDDYEGATPYIKDAYLGDQDLAEYGLNGIIQEVNQTISDSIDFVNQTDVGDFKIVNIEFAEDRIVIRADSVD